MSKDETLQLALEVLEKISMGGDPRWADQAITAIKEALETKDEPVGKFAKFTDGIWREITDYSAGIPLYTTPQRTWVGLTDEDMNNALDYWSDNSRSAYGGAHAANGEYVDMIETWRYIEAKLKEKNGY